VLYAVNTLGAVGGTLLAGFLLLPALGLARTIWVAIGGNVLVFFAAAALARGADLPSPAADSGRVAPLPGAGAWILPLIMISGAVSFSYEVLWTRLLAHVLGGSVYAFATMLGSFLTGIAIGAALAARAATTPDSAARWFAWLQIGTALFSLAAFFGVNAMPELAHAVAVRGWNPLLADAVVAAVTLLPSTLCIGGTFPLAVRILARDEASATPAGGRVYAWNTIGAVLGAIGAGFLIIPALGYAGAVSLAIATNLGLALAATWFTAGWRRPTVWLAAAGLLVLAAVQPTPPWNLLRSSPLTLGTREGRILHYAVGRSTTVLLIEQSAAWALST
jgi:spermidine synthase